MTSEHPGGPRTAKSWLMWDCHFMSRLSPFHTYQPCDVTSSKMGNDVGDNVGGDVELGVRRGDREHDRVCPAAHVCPTPALGLVNLAKGIGPHPWELLG